MKESEIEELAANTAIAELQDYGCSIRVINTLERGIGAIWIRDLLTVTESELRRIANFDRAHIAELKASLLAWATDHEGRARTHDTDRGTTR